MSDKKNRINSNKTGTVPKVKYRINVNTRHAEPIPSQNNVGHFERFPEREVQDFSNYSSRERGRTAFHMFDGQHGSSSSSKQSDLPVPKDHKSKKQDCNSKLEQKKLEEKLNRIKEDLKSTSFMMMSLKNSEQKLEELENITDIINELQESERKLENVMLDSEFCEADQSVNSLVVQQKDGENGHSSESSEGNSENLFPNHNINVQNELDIRMELSGKKIKALQEQQNALLQLQQRAESQLKEAKLAKERLLLAQSNMTEFNNSEASHTFSERNTNSLFDNIQQFQPETNENSDENAQSDSEIPDEYSAVDGNCNRNELMDSFDNEVAHLTNEHLKLHGKLQDINAKKQLEQLVTQLQAGGDEECSDVDDTSDVATKVRQIVTMKEQLAKLKEMLTVVQSAETNLLAQNINSPQNFEAATEPRLLQKTKNTPRTSGEASRAQSAEITGRVVHRPLAARSSTESKPSNRRPLHPREPQKMSQKELHARKQELQNLISKNQASVSGVPSTSRTAARENLYSSDEYVEDENYVRNQPFKDSALQNSIPRSNVSNKSTRGSVTPQSTLNVESVAPRSEVTTAPRSQDASNLQRQLEIMTNLCQMVLDQHHPSNFTHNASPMPIYPEPLSATSVPQVDLWTGPQSGGEGVAAANAHFQSLVLNMLSQCCQLLSLQQREIASLKNSIAVLQENITPSSDSAYPSSTAGFSAQPPLLNHPFSYPYRPVRPTLHKVPACSLPNLANPHQHPQEFAYPNSNVYPQRMHATDANLNNLGLSDEYSQHQQFVSGNTGPNTSLRGWSAGAPALNNQVAPGNRANNYWDNFRSYSRQNLLSSTNKSNEMCQNIPQNTSRMLLTDFTSQHAPKLNILPHESSNSSRTALSELFTKSRSDVATTTNNPPGSGDMPTPQRRNNDSVATTFVPKDNEHHEALGYDTPSGVSVPTEHEATLSRISAEESSAKLSRALWNWQNRNEWNKDAQAENIPQKSKLFDALRENVYQEVATLISANENRPHFLIQLFRDLQLISSDPLRHSTLQSIQSLITHSLAASYNKNRPSSSQGTLEQELLMPQPEGPTIHDEMEQRNKILRNGFIKSSLDNRRLTRELDFMLVEIMQFLSTHTEDILTTEMSNIIRNLVLKFLPLKQLQATHKSLEHPSVALLRYEAVIGSVLQQFLDKRVRDVKENLLQAIIDLILSESARPDQSSREENQSPAPLDISNETTAGVTWSLDSAANAAVNMPLELNPTTTLENGDLAEADQSHHEIEEEGAVGGMLPAENTDSGDVCIEIQQGEQNETLQSGLDQVPIRLTYDRDLPEDQNYTSTNN